MTDKQIIIDGIDVSGCEVFNNKWGTPLCNPTEDIREAVHCSDYPNCLYKKYKRKEQECKDLREDIKDIANLLDLDIGEEYNFGNIELEIKQFKAKEQECEQLKITIEENSYRYAELDADFEQSKKECERLKENNNQFIKDNEFLAKRNSKLKAENDTLFKAIEEVNKINKKLEADNEELKNAYARLNSLYNDNCDYTDKLEKTITEIKETAEDFGFNGTYESYKTAIEQILQKINEVENGKNM